MRKQLKQIEIKTLNDTLELILSQWNIVNSMQDDIKRDAYKAKLEAWTNQVQAKLDKLQSKAA